MPIDVFFNIIYSTLTVGMAWPSVTHFISSLQSTIHLFMLNVLDLFTSFHNFTPFISLSVPFDHIPTNIIILSVLSVSIILQPIHLRPFLHTSNCKVQLKPCSELYVLFRLQSGHSLAYFTVS